MMKNRCLLSALGVIGLCTMTCSETNAVASWTVLVYIEADNNLLDDANAALNDMAAVLTADHGTNILVQLDKPNNKITWRYKIIPGGKINAGNLSSEMGYNPSVELCNAMRWAITQYPAHHYALILKNHGSGVLDFSPGALPKKGLLYDDTQHTCLTNQGLTSALIKIKQMLHKKIDVVAMDACLMAMVEVAYQTKNLVDIFIASENISHGFPYMPMLRTLALSPENTNASQCAHIIVEANRTFYTQLRSIGDFTISAIDIGSIEVLKKSIDKFITAVAGCSKIDAGKTKEIILAARKAAISFQMSDYIDLHSFYSTLLNLIKKTKASQSYKKVLHILAAVINDGLGKITKTVVHNATGPGYAAAKGISIYYPPSGNIHPSYQLTLFAQSTSWMEFIRAYHE